MAPTSLSPVAPGLTSQPSVVGCRGTTPALLAFLTLAHWTQMGWWKRTECQSKKNQSFVLGLSIMYCLAELEEFNLISK